MFLRISSLFKNIHLKETIQICAKTLYNSEFVPPIISKALFTEILIAANTPIEFSFTDTMHKQIDDVAIGSQLGPALASTFVEYYEEKLFG